MYSSFKTNMTQMPKPTMFSVLIYIVVKTEKVPTFSYKILNSYTKPHFFVFSEKQGLLRCFKAVIQPPSERTVRATQLSYLEKKWKGLKDEG